MTAVEVVSSSTALAPLEYARQMLAEATSVDAVKDIRDKAEALRLYARQAGYGLEMQNECAELKLRAERQAGELLAGMPELGRGKSRTLPDLGLSYSQSSRWQQLASLPVAEFDAYIAAAFHDQRELTTSGALKLARQHRAANPTPRPPLQPVDPDAPGLPGLAGRFTTIVADPPWRYDNKATRGAAEDHYPTMTVAELCDMPVDEHANDNAHLYLWTTNGFLRQAFDLFDAWGFTYKAHLAWVKPQMGLGNYFRISHEHVLFGIKGKLPTASRSTMSWFSAARGRHSAKPESFYDLVEASSPGPYLELFARSRRLGDWTAWGNEA
jgi:N6-adenosine-specific RNA methylase IME4